jgi:hypothetical protein
MGRSGNDPEGHRPRRDSCSSAVLRPATRKRPSPDQSPPEPPGAQPRLPVLPKQISQRKRQVFLVFAKAALNRRQNVFLDNRPARRRCKRPQEAKPPLPDNTIRLLGDHTKHPLDAPVVPAERAIRESVVRLLAIAAAFEEQQQRFVPCRGAALQHALDPWSDVAPDLPAKPPVPACPAHRQNSRATSVVNGERLLLPGCGVRGGAPRFSIVFGSGAKMPISPGRVVPPCTLQPAAYNLRPVTCHLSPVT